VAVLFTHYLAATAEGVWSTAISTLPKTNGEVSVRAEVISCNIVGVLVSLCREQTFVGKVLELLKVSRDARHYAK
jgi:hypothetical protein